MRKSFASPFLLVLVVGACASPSPEPASESAGQDPAPAFEGQDPAELAPPQSEEDLLKDAWDRLTLEEQKQAFLVEQHIQNAKDLRSQLRLEDAERELAMALDVDPDNAEARQLMAEVGALIGREPGRIQSLTETLAQEREIAVQQQRERAKENVRSAKAMLARGDYDAAITELTLAQDSIRWAPYSVDWQGLDVEVADLLESSKARREEALQAEHMQAEKASFEALRAEEQAAQARRAAATQNMLDQALAAFNAGKYDEAEEHAQRVLDVDPRNEKAEDVKRSAFKAGRDQMRTETLGRKREQYKVWQEQMDELLVPYVDVITLPDREFWREITELRARRRGIDLSDVIDPVEAELRAKLATTTIPGFVYEDEESLSNVIGGLAASTGLPLHVDPVAETAALDEGVVFNFNLTSPISVEKVLNLITQQAGATVTWTIRHETVLITTVERARGNLVMYNHVVDDLIFGLTDFLGPRIDRLRLIDDLEDDDGGGPFGGIGDRPKIVEGDDLTALVQENVAVGSWEDDGISITVEGGSMIVVHSPEVQREVRAFLEDLRRFSSSIVTIESKFLTIEDNYLQEIGVEFRGLDNQVLDDVTNGLEDMASLGLDNQGSGDASGPPSAGFFYDDGEDGDFIGAISQIFETPRGDTLTNVGGMTAQWTFLDDAQVSAILHLVEKQENLEILNDQVLSVHNTQRAFVTAINQQAYIQDFDVEVAQFEAVADPQINVLEEGIVLEVRPTIQHDRKYITLEVQPTVANVVALTDFSTTLGGQTQAVTFQLPEVEVQSVFTTAVVPDGGTILLGGLSRIRNIERRAEVPWMANIPLVGFFFKEEGYNDEKSSLMIMIRAWITDVRSELERLETD
jgi:tetratricopeptide (TPR) repeat protein